MIAASTHQSGLAGGPALPLTGVDGWTINPNSDNVDLAVAFAKRMVQPDILKIFADLAVHIPAMSALLLVVADADLVADVRSAMYLAAIFAMLYLAGAYFLALFMSLARG